MSCLQPGAGTVSRAMSGALAGAIGGAASGVFVANLELFADLGLLFGAESIVFGALVHVALSCGVGAVFSLLVPETLLRYVLPAGAVYGMVWWLVIPVALIPAWVMVTLESAVIDFALMCLAGQALQSPIMATTLWWLRRLATGPQRD